MQNIVEKLSDARYTIYIHQVSKFGLTHPLSITDHVETKQGNKCP